MKHKTFQGSVLELLPLSEGQILVFGSNMEGRHGKGLALIAVQYCGAKYGQASGMQGQSYAIITKDLRKKNHPSISPEFIKKQLEHLYNIAEGCEYEFIVGYSGEGENLNGYSPKEMAIMFASFPIPNNFVFEETFYQLILEEINKDKIGN